MAVYQITPQSETLHGVLDAALPPALTIRSGDTLAVTTLEADWRTEKPDARTRQAPYFPRIPGRDDGQALCGPVFMEGLLPGMTLRIDIDAIETDNWGWSCVGIGNQDHLNRLGYAGTEPYFQLWDIQSGICRSESGMVIPADPFPGILAVAPQGTETFSTHLPGAHGGNLDCRELRPGTTLFLPVFHEGGLFSVGDGHAAQGDGESGGTAVECPFRQIRLTLHAAAPLIKNPVARTEHGILTFGFDTDLTAAAYQALENMRRLLAGAFDIKETEAMTLCSVAADVRITQIVNGIRGAHVILPHKVWNMLKARRRSDMADMLLP